MDDSFLEQRTRAEDILLGYAGYGEDATIISIERTTDGYTGKGKFRDGEIFEFSSTDEVDELEEWALNILTRSEPDPTV